MSNPVTTIVRPLNVPDDHLPRNAEGHVIRCVVRVGDRHWSNPRFEGLPWAVDKPMTVCEWVGDVPRNAGFLLAKWTGRYKTHQNLAADEVDEVKFQAVAHDSELSKSVGYGFGETGDKPHTTPNKEIRRIAKRYDRRNQTEVEDQLIAAIGAGKKLFEKEPLPITLVHHDTLKHVMPAFDKSENNGGLPQGEQRLDGIKREELGGISWREVNRKMREALNLPRNKGFKPPVGMTALEFDWWETRLAAEARKDHETEQVEYKKKFEIMLTEAREIASTNAAFIAWELEWKAYFASRGMKKRPRVSPAPAAECEWYGQLCALTDLFTRPGKSIIKQSRSGRLSGMKIREVELHTVKFEKQFELKCAGIRTEIKEGKYNNLKLKVDALQHVTKIKEMTSIDAGRICGKTGAAMRQRHKRRLETLAEAARSRMPLGAAIRDMERFQKAAPDGVRRGWYILIQLPHCKPRLYPVEPPAADTREALLDVVHAAMLKVASEMAARRIIKFGRKKISYGKAAELGIDTLKKVREAFSQGHIFSPEDCDVYNPSPSRSHSAARVESQEAA